MGILTRSKMERTAREIAQRALSIETPEARGRDSLDFHDLHIDRVLNALEIAYEAGARAVRDGDR